MVKRYHVDLVRILQRSRTRRVKERRDVSGDFKELAHTAVGPDKSKIGRAGWKFW